MKTLALACMIALLAHCKKDKSTDDKTPFSGIITITSPTENGTITGGNSFVLTATVTGNSEMHGYQVEIFNVATNESIFVEDYHEHATSYTINETVAHTLTTTTNLRALIEVATNHEGTLLTKEVYFTYEP